MATSTAIDLTNTITCYGLFEVHNEAGYIYEKRLAIYSDIAEARSTAQSLEGRMLIVREVPVLESA